MINSLRLELMDESSILLGPNNLIRMSPLYLYPISTTQSVLLQVILVRSATTTDLWCPEKARAKRRGVPLDAVLTGSATEEMKQAGRIIERISLSKIGNDGSKWRKCDWDSFSALRRLGVIDQLMSHAGNDAFSTPDPAENKMTVITQKFSAKSAFDLAHCVNQPSPSMEAFRMRTVEPWAPILWDDANRIFFPLQDSETRRRIMETMGGTMEGTGGGVIEGSCVDQPA